ncbi:MAG: response regulator transcription factor [Rhodocyclaceae bacterium]|nr:response regulator transcription factor [Rhodocyclaceae bacterium]
MKFLVIDDHEMVREGLCGVLAGLYGNIELVQAGSVAEGREIIRSDHGFDLAILDMVLPDGSGLELMDELELFHPEVPMIAVSGDNFYMDEALRRGALGFLPKSADSDDFLEAIGSVLAGQVYVPNSLGQAERSPYLSAGLDDEPLHATGSSPRLSGRQKVVLRLIMQGLSNKDISERLTLAESTVKVHVSAILRALNVHSRTQAVLTAARLKILA